MAKQKQVGDFLIPIPAAVSGALDQVLDVVAPIGQLALNRLPLSFVQYIAVNVTDLGQSR